MPVLDAVQTFAGIANENKFYSHHYLTEVFKGDIKAKHSGDVNRPGLEKVTLSGEWGQPQL